MEDSRELKILTDTDGQQPFVDALDKALTDGWSRNLAQEKQGIQNLGKDEYRCYACAAASGREPATIVLHRDDDGALHYVNVFPAGSEELSLPQQNRILESFYAIARPVADAMGVSVEWSDIEVNFEEILGEQAWGSLRRFEGAANRSTGNSHPLDAERWDSFMCDAHRFGSRLDSDFLKQWFEEQGWSESVALKLVIDYEKGRRLLKHFEESGS